MHFFFFLTKEYTKGFFFNPIVFLWLREFWVYWSKSILIERAFWDKRIVNVFLPIFYGDKKKKKNRTHYNIIRNFFFFFIIFTILFQLTVILEYIMYTDSSTLYVSTIIPHTFHTFDPHVAFCYYYVNKTSFNLSITDLVGGQSSHLITRVLPYIYNIYINFCVLGTIRT